MIEHATRLRVGRAVAKTETAAACQMLQTVQQRGNPDGPPALASDGWGGHREALVTVYGKVPSYQGRGRPPTRPQPQAGWQYLQVVKQREQGHVIGVTPQVVYGEAAQVRALLGEHTADVERTHLTSRLMNGRLVRKTLGFSKALAMLQAACAWEDAVYNLMRPVKTLRLAVRDRQRRWQARSPGMAAGLTDHLWTIDELLTRIPVPSASSETVFENVVSLVACDHLDLCVR